MRSTLFLCALICAPLPAAAWEARSGETCRIVADTPAAAVEIAYFPVAGLYTLRLTRREEAWPQAGVFAIRFTGAALTITTRDHFAPDGDPAVLAVIDAGFGNVLGGLASGGAAELAFDGRIAARLPLAGAAPAVAAFLDCTSAVPS
ncbi:hypothetical protein DXV76_02765 [Rhodobacteraceae bacterium CCMM004]|nr:hypothetical protein DXV76_02765 [Rhodobacteraceae bacterium CCMM004]